MSVNKAILVGNLGADPEVKQTASGTQVCRLSIATNERRKTASGDWQDATEWHRVVCFGRTAENAARFLKKGRSVYVEGKIRTSKYQDKEGRDRWATEVICDSLQFLSNNAGEGRDEPRRVAPQDFAREVGNAAGLDMADIPF